MFVEIVFAQFFDLGEPCPETSWGRMFNCVPLESFLEYATSLSFACLVYFFQKKQYHGQLQIHLPPPNRVRMHHHILRILLWGLLPLGLLAQPTRHPEGWDTLDQIIALRAQLKTDLRRADYRAAAVHTDSLRLLTNPEHTTLFWDERWLVYYLTGRYALLLDEVATHTPVRRAQESNPAPVPSDSLFEVADGLVYERFEVLVGDVATEVPKAEDRDFLLRHLHYLLRNQSETEQDKRADFLKKYPESRFALFVRNFMALPPKPQKYLWTGELALLNLNWQDQLARSVEPGWGIHAGLGVWKKRWGWRGTFNFCAPKLAREVDAGDRVWERDTSVLVMQVGMELTYDVLNRQKIRLYPAVSAGWIRMVEGGAESLSDYAYRGPVWSAALHADIKLRKPEPLHRRALPRHRGVWVSAGYQWLPFGEDNAALRGGAFFIALGTSTLGF
jgi:hypothetical protein